MHNIVRPTATAARPKAIECRIREIRSKLETNPPVSAEEKDLASFVQLYLNDAAHAREPGQRFEAQRLVDAADSCRGPIDHLENVTATRPLPDHPNLRVEPDDHWREVHFRLRLSKVFLKQISDPPPKRLLARAFYDRAVKAQQGGRDTEQDEYTKAADDLTHALESLAQASIL